MKIRIIIAVVVVLLVGVGLYKYFFGGPMTVATALNNGYVTAAIQGGVGGNSADPSTVIVKLTGTSKAPGSFKVAIPCGTVIDNGQTDGQTLMVAHTVVLGCTAANGPTAARVETYCLTQFGLCPSASTPLSFAAESSAAQDTSNPVVHLCQEMEHRTEPFNERQSTIWMVGGDYMDKTAQQTADELTSKFSATIAQELPAAAPVARAGWMQSYEQINPDVSLQTAAGVFARTDGAISKTMWNDERETRSEELAQNELTDFLNEDRSILVDIDPSAAQKPLFNSPLP